MLTVRAPLHSPRTSRHSSAWVSEACRWYAALCIKAAVDRKVINSARRGIRAVQSAKCRGWWNPSASPPILLSTCRWEVMDWPLRWPHIGTLCCEPTNFQAMRQNHGRCAARQQPTSHKTVTTAWCTAARTARIRGAPSLTASIRWPSLLCRCYLFLWKPVSVGNFNPEEVVSPSGLEIWIPCTPLVYFPSTKLFGYYIA